MRILLIHNYYGSSAPSGENKVFEAEKAMMENHGHEVGVYTRHSDEIRNGNVIARLWGKIKGAMCTVGNPFAARAVAKKCREFKPDIVHFHNTFPLISPLAVRAASKYASVVMTLHNYRTACAAGVPTRAGKVCSLCLDKKCVWDGIKHQCYRGSLFATLPLAINIALYRKKLPRWVSRFIVLSEFQKRKMVEYGWPEEKIEVKGNFVFRQDSQDLQDLNTHNHVNLVNPVQEKKDQIVYVGRLSKEKGVETLIKAFRLLCDDGFGCIKRDETSNPLRPLRALRLKIVGDGVDRVKLAELAKGLNVEFVGLKPVEEVRRLMSESKVTILPSEWWETFGLTVVESMLEGTPVVVSNLGALPEIVQDGRFGEVFEAGNIEDCAAAIRRLLTRPDYNELCVAVRREAETKYSEEANYNRLMDIYDGMNYND